MSREELEREEVRAQEASQAGVDSKSAVVSGELTGMLSLPKEMLQFLCVRRKLPKGVHAS